MSNLRHALVDPAARRLFAAHAQSCVGSGMAFVALPLLAYEFSGSAWAVTAVLLPDIVPAIVLGPLLGAIIDRFGWRRAMIAADLSRALAFVLLWQAHSLPMAIAGAAIAGIGSAVFNPAALTALGTLAPDGERRAAAMGLFGALDDAGLTLGPALAGILLAVVAPAALMAVNAATFGLSALMLLTLRTRGELAPAPSAQEPSLLAAAVSAWRTIAARPQLRLLLSSSAAAVACIGVTNVGEVVLAREVLHVGGPGLAALMAANGVGLIAGSLAARQEGGWRWRRAYQAGLACMATELVLCSVGLGLFPLLAVFALGGFGNGFALVHDRLLLASSAPPEIHGRVFAFQKACTSLAFGASFVAAGVMIAGVGVQVAFLLAGVTLAGVLAVAAPRLRREWPSPAGEESVSRRTARLRVPQPAADSRR